MISEAQILRERQQTYRGFLRLAVVTAVGCIVVVAFLAAFAT